MCFQTKESFRAFLQQHAGEVLSTDKIRDMVDLAFPPSQVVFIIPFPSPIERAIAGEHLYLE